MRDLLDLVERAYDGDQSACLELTASDLWNRRLIAKKKNGTVDEDKTHAALIIWLHLYDSQTRA